MSRLRNLKERKRKTIMKATSYGLALALVLGSSQGLGTYALFTDTETIPSEISLSTGDVDVEVNGGTTINDFQYGQIIPLSVKITNKRTLNQNLKLEIEGSLKDYIEYNFEFNNLNLDENGVVYKDEELFILAPGHSIDGIVNVTLNTTKEQQEDLSQNPQNINLKVISRQINSEKLFSESGFYDEDIQINTITIAKPPTEEDDNILESGNNGALKVTPADKLEGEKTINRLYRVKSRYGGILDVIDRLDGELKFKGNKEEDIKIISQSGAFEGSKITVRSDDIMAEYVNSSLIENDYGKGHHIDISIKYSKNISKNYRIDIKEISKHGNRLAEAKVTLLDNQVIQEDDGLKEEIEVPSNPEVVNPPKEETEVPNKPEVVEPPKEEEIELPNKPEVIEPPKENEELQ